MYENLDKEVHEFYTETAKNIRNYGKSIRIQELKKILKYEEEAASRL